MTATLDVLPGTKLIAVPRLSAEQRAIRLARLAADVLEQPGRLPASDVAVLLSAYASDCLCGDKLTGAWAEYLDAIRLEDDTDTGVVSWQQIEPRLTCAEPQEAAKEWTRANARDALAVLVNGEMELGEAS